MGCVLLPWVVQTSHFVDPFDCFMFELLVIGVAYVHEVILKDMGAPVDF